ncbi:CDP-diacylglycerol diphosphatase [Methylocella sp.]|uniref:CDP-diacylglycerol diphosphatase n=1 Tax=Methylocella sp. TaxID=1978226 RepID=UPI003784C937
MPRSDLRSRAVLGRRARAAVAGAALAWAAAAPPATAGSDALWSIVNGLCVPDQRMLNSPAPCAAVDLDGGEANGFAVLKDLRGRTQFLLIPTLRIAGMEDPRLGAPGLPNYWRAAWSARHFVEAAAPEAAFAREDMAMTINGAGARTQNQLHIHLDCPRVDVARELRKRADEIGAAFADFSMFGKTYRARRILGEAPAPDPFLLVAADAPSAPLADNSIAVFGARFSGAPGFVLLARKAPHGRVHLEDLQDHGCGVLEARPAREAGAPN